MTADTGEPEVTPLEITHGTGTDLDAGTGTAPARAAAGTELPDAGTNRAGTGTEETSGTGTSATRTGRWQRIRTGLRGTNRSTKRPANAPVPVPVPPTEREHRADAARTEAAVRAAARRTAETAGTRTGARRRTATAGTGEQPLPQWMASTGLWLDRTVGVLPLLAPMIVSGYYTFHVGRNGLDMPWPFALALTLALEGGAWKLARLYEKRLVAGHSTLADRAGLAFYVALISGLIFWFTTGSTADHGRLATAAAVPADAAPAAAAAAMAALGVFIWGRTARWNRRAELAEAGRLDMQALRIGVWQWIVSPWESAWSFRHGMKYRIPVPAEAVRDWKLWKAADKPDLWPPVLPAGTGTTGEPVAVPAWLLAEITGIGTGTRPVPGAPAVPVPVSPAPAGAASRTDATASQVPGTAGTGTDQFGDDSDEVAVAEIARYRERHRERLITVKANLRGPQDERWDTIRPADMTLSVITAAGGFSNKVYAREIKAVLRYDQITSAVDA